MNGSILPLPHIPSWRALGKNYLRIMGTIFKYFSNGFPRVCWCVYSLQYSHKQAPNHSSGFKHLSNFKRQISRCHIFKSLNVSCVMKIYLVVCVPIWPLQYSTNTGYPDAKFRRVISITVSTDLMYPWHQMFVASRTINWSHSLHSSRRTVNRADVTSLLNEERCEKWKQ
jgi:hypothetical protein